MGANVSVVRRTREATLLPETLQVMDFPARHVKAPQSAYATSHELA